MSISRVASAARCRGDPGDEREVIVLAATRAGRCPAAHVAMLDGLGVRRREAPPAAARPRDRGRRPRSAPWRHGNGHEVVDPQGGRLTGAASSDAHALGSDALKALELLDIGADLEDGAGLHVASELRVRDLVVVRPPDRGTGRVIDSEQEVRVTPQPAPVEERRTVDPRRPTPWPRASPRLSANLRASIGVVVAVDLDDRLTLCTELVEIARLVGEPTLADDLELAVLTVRSIENAVQDRTLEDRQVLAGQ